MSVSGISASQLVEAYRETSNAPAVSPIDLEDNPNLSASPDNSLPKLTGRYKDSIEVSNLTIENSNGIEKPQNDTDSDKLMGVEIIAPTEASKHPMPILIFSNGWTEHSSQYEQLLKNIASHGYVVVNLDHPSSSGPDSIERTPEEESAYTNMLAHVQANNIRFIVQQIQDGALKNAVGKVGLTNEIVLGGHSMGGASSLLVAENDPSSSIKGCINLDGGLTTDEVEKGKDLKIPSLLLHADYANILKPVPDNIEKILKGWEEFHKNSNSNSMEVIKGIIHLSFCQSSFSNHEKIPDLNNETWRESAFAAYNAASGNTLEFLKKIFP